ncbi:MAG: deoxynucleoside kinase [archaeon]|nr:deoxynucleoside kinase [archaeon]
MSKRIGSRTPKIICIEGIHGVGKTTTFNILKRTMNDSKTNFYPERIAAKPLWPFGSSNKGIAFRSEVHFIQQMIERQKNMEKNLRYKKKKIETCFLDRSAVCVMVYSKSLNLKPKDFQVLKDIYHSVNWLENVIFYLEASPEIILERIKKRGSLDPERLEWNEDDINYIKLLEKNYDFYLKKSKIKVIKINTNDLNASQTAELIKNEIDKLFPVIIPNSGQEQLDSYFKN